MFWTTIEEGLPTNNGKYLVTRTSCDDVVVMNFDTSENIFYWCGYDSEGLPDEEYADDVIAWLPFPKPYKKPNMIKVAINTCYGGFCLSKEAYEFLGIPWDGFGYDYASQYNEKRTDPKLIECIEMLGKKANGNGADIEIVEVPDNVDWYIDDYDGVESIEEEHDSWY